MKTYKIIRLLLSTALFAYVGSTPLRAQESEVYTEAYPNATVVTAATDAITQVNVIQFKRIIEDIYNGSGYNKKISHYDKAGRLLQTINMGASPSGKNVIKFYEYDCMGRADSIAYLPYTSTSGGGELISNPKEEQRAFYQSLFPSPDDYNYAYTSKKYASAPFNQVMKEGGVGKKYTANIAYPDHCTSYTYGKNTANEVYKYVIGAAGTVSATQKYPADALTMTASCYNVGANPITTVQYKDASGKLIAKSVHNIYDGTSYTYYVYDDMDRLRYIVPDVAHRKVKDVYLSHNPEAYREYWYYYEYDAEGRVIRSIKPGKADEYFVYDKKGRIVMTQDGNMREENKWAFLTYDTYDRQIDKNIIKDTGTTPKTRAQIQSLFDSGNFTPFDSTSQFVVSICLENQFYDRYVNFTPIEFVPVAGIVSSDMLAQVNNGRLLHERLAIIMDEPHQSRADFFKRTYYYDKKGRVIQKVEYDSPSGTTVRYSYKYDLADNILTSMEVHQDSYGNQNTKRVDYTIDKYGRILSELTTVNNGVPVKLTYTYNELGELASRTFGNTGITETYDYDLQGSLKAQDSKRMSIDYFYDTQDAVYGNKPRYDGNVSLVKWTYKTTTPKEEAYVYEYDNWGQLKSGVYYENYKQAGIYDERMQYDRSGNIKKMDRSGSTAGKSVAYDYSYNGYQLTSIAYRDNAKMGTYTYTYDDNGNMTYNGNRNLRYVYNHLNLLSNIVDPNAGMAAIYTWLADGTKYTAQSVLGIQKTRFYRGSFTYTSNRISDIETVVFSGGQFLPEKSGSSYIMTPSFVLTDRLGSPRVVMNSAGTPVTYNSYYPFGLTHYDYLYSDQMVKANRFMFNGKEKQAFSTSMDFKLLDYGARMYDPTVGRWTTQDPAGQFTNPYIFCGNNPVCFIDADGQWVMFVPMIIGAIAGGYTGYRIGKAAGASGWDMAGYIFGGAGIGALASGAAVGIAATGGGAMLAGMGAGFLGGAGFNLLAGGSFIDAMKAGAIGGFVGLLSGGIGAAVGGRLGAIAAGMVGSGTYAALSGASPEDIAKAAFLGGVTSYGVYELTSYISYKYILSNAENQSNGMYALKMTYREYMAMQADFQRSRFWHKEYGLVMQESGNIERTPYEKRNTYNVQLKEGKGIKYNAHTHWVAKEGKTIYLDQFGNKMPHLEMYRNEATRMHGAMDIFKNFSLVLGVNSTTLRLPSTTITHSLNFPRFEYFPWFIF